MENNQRVRLTKQLLENALIKILAEKSIHDISVREICDRAQINRTTFYKYYGSQYDLLTAIENGLLRKIEETLGDKRGAEYSIEILAEILIYLDNNIEICRTLLNNNVDPEFPVKLLNLPGIKQTATAQFASVYNPAEMEYVYEFVVGGAFMFIQKWLNNEQREPPNKVAALLGSVIFKLSAV